MTNFAKRYRVVKAQASMQGLDSTSSMLPSISHSHCPVALYSIGLDYNPLGVIVTCLL